MMLFATWGWSIHPDQLLIVEAAIRHLLEPQNLTRIVQDPVCGEIFVLCRTRQEVDVTPSVLHYKSFTKTCHEHHVYVLMQVIKSVDPFP